MLTRAEITSMHFWRDSAHQAQSATEEIFKYG
jgi:hypothetical protein